MWFTVLRYGVVGLACAGVSVWATRDHYLGQIAGIELSMSKADLANSEAQLKQYTANTNRLASAELDVQKANSVLNLQLNTAIGDLKNAQRHSPLPVNCRPDAERVRSLAQAIAAANTAASQP